MVTTPPTPHEQRCWDALHEHRSYSAAAQSLGMETSSLRQAVKSYMRKVEHPGPPPFARPYNRKPLEDPVHVALQGRIDSLVATVAERDATIERLRDRMADLEAAARPFAELHRKLDVLLARASSPAVVTHRRRADGGTGGKAERKGRAA